MDTHPAVVTVAPRAPLEILEVPTVSPSEDEVRIRVEWTASTPLDLHQADGGLLVSHPQVLGDSQAGTVVEVGSGIKDLEVNDKVFGFSWRSQKEKAHQNYVTTSENLLGKIPTSFTMQQAVTLPNNFSTVFHTVITDFGLELPWPRPANYEPEHADAPIMIWGGSSSVGQYALQILHYYGYRNLLATSSKKHHDQLRSYGCTHVFDYNQRNTVQLILETATSITRGPTIPFILDCIASKTGSIAPLAQIAQKGAKVAVLLPVIIRDASESDAPEYTFDVEGSATWAEGVEAIGVRTHFYLDNPFLAQYLQPTIMPAMLSQGIIKPSKQRIVEGKTLLVRAQTALDMLRRKEVSGERLVWRVG